MPTANRARSVARPAQGNNSAKPAKTFTNLADQKAPNYRVAGKTGTAGRSTGKRVYADTVADYK
jgi:cell division protein FtsI/penicillin-binding protein 2